jgi:hypothetical protein
VAVNKENIFLQLYIICMQIDITSIVEANYV